MMFASLSATLLAGPALAEQPHETARDTFEPLPWTVSAVKGNRITPEKIELGKALFFDPRLSPSGVFSCNSCHNLPAGGDDNMQTSVGHG